MITETKDLIAAIKTAADLDALIDALETAESEYTRLDILSAEADSAAERRDADTEAVALRDALVQACCDLPTWGPAPAGLNQIFSWDESRILYQGDQGWQTSEREDTIHSLPPAWRVDGRRGEASLSAGWSIIDNRVYGVVRRGEGGWEYEVEGIGETSEGDDYTLAREAAHAAEQDLARIVLTVEAQDLADALSGRQQDIAVKLGVSQSVVSEWRSGGHEMSRAVRHLILALLGCTWRMCRDGWGWRFRR
jgi:DNA-binding transcriptional regulator YiaG